MWGPFVCIFHVLATALRASEHSVFLRKLVVYLRCGATIEPLLVGEALAGWCSRFSCLWGLGIRFMAPQTPALPPHRDR
jgi:hypothetical protein